MGCCCGPRWGPSMHEIHQQSSARRIACDDGRSPRPVKLPAGVPQLQQASSPPSDLLQNCRNPPTRRVLPKLMVAADRRGRESAYSQLDRNRGSKVCSNSKCVSSRSNRQRVLEPFSAGLRELCIGPAMLPLKAKSGSRPVGSAARSGRRRTTPYRQYLKRE
jgi:hypothetical protein